MRKTWFEKVYGEPAPVKEEVQELPKKKTKRAKVIKLENKPTFLEIYIRPEPKFDNKTAMDFIKRLRSKSN